MNNTDKQVTSLPKYRYFKPGQVLYVPSWPERFAILFRRRNVMFTTAILMEHKPGATDVSTTFKLTKDKRIPTPEQPQKEGN